jgi:hypothetical protein
VLVATTLLFSTVSVVKDSNLDQAQALGPAQIPNLNSNQDRDQAQPQALCQAQILNLKSNLDRDQAQDLEWMMKVTSL